MTQASALMSTGNGTAGVNCFMNIRGIGIIDNIHYFIIIQVAGHGYPFQKHGQSKL